MSSCTKCFRTIFTVGASAGIGAETAVHFARQGASLVLTARGQDGLKATATRCRDEAGTKPEQVK